MNRPDPMGEVEKREEHEFYRERRIQELEREIKDREARELQLNDQIFR